MISRSARRVTGAAEAEQDVAGAGGAAVALGPAAHPGVVVPGGALHRVAAPTERPRGGGPLEDVAGQVEVTVRSGALGVCLHRHGVVRAAVRAVEAGGIVGRAEGIGAALGTARGLLQLGGAGEAPAAPGAVGGGFGVGDEDDGVVV